MLKYNLKMSGSGYDYKKYKELYENDLQIGGKRLLECTQYGLESNKVVNPTRYFINFIEQTKIILKLAQLKNKKVLDIGCGDGVIPSLVNNYYSYIGIDISSHRIKRCEKNYKNKKTNFRIVDVNLGLPFTDDTFDCVIASEIIEHVLSTEFFLKEIKRVLKKKGVIVISTPNSLNNIEHLGELYHDQHLRAYSIGQLKSELESFGFNVVEIETIGLQFIFKLEFNAQNLLFKKIYRFVKGKEFSKKKYSRAFKYELIDNIILNSLYKIIPNKIWTSIFNFFNSLGKIFKGYSNQIIIKAESNE